MTFQFDAGLIPSVPLATEDGRDIVTEDGSQLLATSPGPVQSWPLYKDRAIRTWSATPARGGHGSKVGGWSRRLVTHMLVKEQERSVIAASARENARQFRAALLQASLIEETRVAQAKSYLEGTMYSILLAEL